MRWVLNLQVIVYLRAINDRVWLIRNWLSGWLGVRFACMGF
jgi:hypothetical protein